MGLTLTGASELAERAWRDGRTVWLTDLAAAPESARVIAALNQEMVSGWAVPVRAGSKVLAVLEFYCHFRLREDREAMAAVETAAASMGQMLARTQESGRADELSRQQEILLDAVADGICGLDRKGKVSFANPAAARLLGAASRCADRQAGARAAARRSAARPRLRQGLPAAQRRRGRPAASTEKTTSFAPTAAPFPPSML